MRRVLMIMKGHRLLRADVPSCRSVPFLNSTGYLDGKLIERAGAWHAAWLQKHAGTGTLSRDRDGRAKLNAARIDASIGLGVWLTSYAAH